MNDQQLAKAWSTIGLFLLVFSVDSWLRTQGLAPIFGSKLPHTERVASALLGFIINAFASGLLLRVAFASTHRQSSGTLACASHLMDRTEFMLLYSIHIDDEDHLNVVTQVAEQTMTFDSRLDVQ